MTKALKLKLEGGECILVDARKPTGSWDPPTINKNLLFHEREMRTLKPGFKLSGQLKPGFKTLKPGFNLSDQLKPWF